MGLSTCVCVGPGWPGCHVITKLIFVLLNRHTRISTNWASWDKKSAQAHVIIPLQTVYRTKEYSNKTYLRSCHHSIDSGILSKICPGASQLELAHIF